MPSVSELVEDVAAVMGERVESVNAFARALIDAELLPKSRGRAVAQVSYKDIAVLVTAVALEPKIKDTALVVASYLDLKSGHFGFQYDSPPFISAGEWLEQFLATVFTPPIPNQDMAERRALLLQEISFVKSRPEISVRRKDGTLVIRFAKKGAMPLRINCIRTATVYGQSFRGLGTKSGRTYMNMQAS